MYNESQLDRDNKSWFNLDKSIKTLQRLKLEDGNIRGLNEFDVGFSYPITCFVGKNGSGKTTFLSLCACAYHKVSGEDFSPLSRNGKEYYTFRDFFIFGPDEEGIKKLKLSVFCPGNTPKESCKVFSKKPSGKWKDYDQRFQRKVTYLGINRIVPPAEDSKHKSRRNSFVDSQMDDAIKATILRYMNNIFSSNYSEIYLDNANSKRSDCYLFKAKRGEVTYTGFNMGAGEHAVFFMLYQLLTMGRGGLLVVDEIELGLHTLAQKKLINVLKEICKINHCQIICSTHSSAILEALPHDARFLIENKGGLTSIQKGITAEYAFGVLSGAQTTQEAKIFVEDSIAAELLSMILKQELRKRVVIYPIGSIDSAIPHQIAASLRLNDKKFIVVADGDQRKNKERILENTKKELIDRHIDLDESIGERILFLPGSAAPEKEVIDQVMSSDNLESLLNGLGLSDDKEFRQMISSILNVEHHDYFYELHIKLNLNEEAIRTTFFSFYKTMIKHDCEELNDNIERIVNGL